MKVTAKLRSILGKNTDQPTITVTVTQTDIDMANKLLQRDNTVMQRIQTAKSILEYCPIANAARRLYPNSDIEVSYQRIRIDGIRYVTTKPYKGIIEEFAHLLYRPITFEITKESP